MEKAIFLVSYYGASPDCLHGSQRSWLLLSPRKLWKDYVKLFFLCFHHFIPVKTWYGLWRPGMVHFPSLFQHKNSSQEAQTALTSVVGLFKPCCIPLNHQWKLNSRNQKELQHLRKKEYSRCYPSTFFSKAPRQIAS